MKRLTGLFGLLAVLLCVNAQSAPLSATNIGGMWTTTPITTAATQALTGFRGAFTPMNIGMAVGTYVIISTIGDGINTLRMQMGSNLPAAQLPAVPGWTNPNSPPSTVTPITTNTYTIGSFTSSDLANVINQKAAEIRTAQGCPGVPAQYCPQDGAYSIIDSSAYVIHFNWPNASVFGTKQVNITTSLSCPNGYTLSGASCVLSNSSAVQWPTDGVPTLQHNGSAYVPHSRDPDNAGQPASSSPYTRTGTDQYQNPVKETLTPNVVGGTDYRRDTQGVNSQTGEPLVQRDTFSTDQTGQVLATASVQFPNSTISNVNTSTTTQSLVDVTALAKDATLNVTNTRLNEIKTALQPQTFSQPSQAATRTFQQSTDLVKAAFTAKLPTVVFSDVVPDCPVFQAHIPFLDFDMVIDEFCTMDPLIRPILNIMSLFSFSLFGFFIILRA